MRSITLFKTLTASFALVTLLASAGCGLMGGAVGGMGGDDLDFAEFMQNEIPEGQSAPFATIMETGAPELDEVAISASHLANATYAKTKSYIEQCENNDVYNAYQNDMAGCDTGDEAADEACRKAISEALTPEQSAAIQKFKADQSKVVEAQLAELVSVAMLGKDVAEATKAMDKSKALSAASAIGQVKQRISFLTQAQQYYNTQKATMDAFEAYAGR